MKGGSRLLRLTLAPLITAVSMGAATLAHAQMD